MEEGSCSEEFLKAVKQMIRVVTLPPEEARRELEIIEENCKNATKSCPVDIKNMIETHLKILKMKTGKFLPTSAEERLFEARKIERSGEEDS